MKCTDSHLNEILHPDFPMNNYDSCKLALMASISSLSLGQTQDVANTISFNAAVEVSTTCRPLR